MADVAANEGTLRRVSNGSDTEIRPPEHVERFVRQLAKAHKAVRLYPADSDIATAAAQGSVDALAVCFEERPELTLAVGRSALGYSGIAVFPDESSMQDFAREFYGKHLAEVCFSEGIDAAEIARFLVLLNRQDDELLSSDDFEAWMWDANIVNVTVSMAMTIIADAGAEESDVSAFAALSTRDIDELIAGAFAGRKRDQQMLMRVVEDQNALTGYLEQSAREYAGDHAGTWVAGRVGAIAHVLSGEPAEIRTQLYDSIADSVMALEDEVRHEAIQDGLLPTALHDDVVAEVVRELDLDDLCGVLASGLEDSAESQEGLARALRNLLMIGGGTREEIMDAAQTAMTEAGSSPEAISEIVSQATPTQIEVKQPAPQESGESPLSRVLKLMDAVPSGEDLAGEDPAIAALRREAERGVTNADIARVLAAVAWLQTDDTTFGAIISHLEDYLGLLLDREEYADALSVIDVLFDAALDEERPPEQRARVVAALKVLLEDRTVRSIAHALGRYEEGSEEYDACVRLLKRLGAPAVPTLLEVLADEPDQTQRKILVDVLTESADDYLDELSAYLGDNRWYLVRNVVGVIGSAHDPRAVALLQRTIRYPEPRVRRETLRAGVKVGGRAASGLLESGLGDEDGENVRLAMQLLAEVDPDACARGASRVAAGEGSGDNSRETRLAAVEVLARLNADEARAGLERLAAIRGFKARGLNREVREAAKAALAGAGS